MRRATIRPDYKSRAWMESAIASGYTLTNLADMFDVHRETIRKWVRAHQLPPPLERAPTLPVLEWDNHNMRQLLEAGATPEQIAPAVGLTARQTVRAVAGWAALEDYPLPDLWVARTAAWERHRYATGTTGGRTGGMFNILYWEKGWTVRQIAECWGVDPQTVRRWANLWGCELRPRGPRPKAGDDSGGGHADSRAGDDQPEQGTGDGGRLDRPPGHDGERDDGSGHG